MVRKGIWVPPDLYQLKCHFAIRSLRSAWPANSKAHLKTAGGIPGYYNLLEAIGDPQHQENQDLLDWLGGEFDPEAFSEKDVNQRLAPLQRWWSKTQK